ncbi:MAG: hypothetical protein QOG15_1636, partial [Solirubrobacteraceae bacterium]|nr:hypothetical protein [Solirubrobacteraceae bacterium]
LYAIDDAGDVRPIRLDERSAGDALHREHAITCQTCSIAQAEAA